MKRKGLFITLEIPFIELLTPYGTLALTHMYQIWQITLIAKVQAMLMHQVKEFNFQCIEDKNAMHSKHMQDVLLRNGQRH
jgi:hypothetical protein